MPLEDVGIKLLEAVERLTAVIEESNAGRAEVLAAANKITDKPAAKTAAEKKAETDAAKKAAEEAGGGAAEGPTLDDVKKAIAAYAGAHDHPPEREARKAKATEILAKVGATKATEVPADKFAAVVKAFTTLAEKNELLAPAPEADGGDGEDGDLLG